MGTDAPGLLSESWATLWEALADAQPDHTALVIGDRQMTWQDYYERAARLAGALGARGAGHGTRIAELLFNCPEYMEVVYAAFKLRATPVNVNYRYKAPEIAYICDDAGAEVLVFHGSLGDRVTEALPSMPSVRTLLQVDDGSPLIDGAEWYFLTADYAFGHDLYRVSSRFLEANGSTIERDGFARLEHTPEVHEELLGYLLDEAAANPMRPISPSSLRRFYDGWGERWF